MAERKPADYNFAYYHNHEQTNQKRPSGLLVFALSTIVISLTGLAVMITIALVEPIIHEDPQGAIHSGVMAYCLAYAGYLAVMLAFMALVMIGLFLLVITRRKKKKR